MDSYCIFCHQEIIINPSTEKVTVYEFKGNPTCQTCYYEQIMELIKKKKIVPFSHSA